MIRLRNAWFVASIFGFHLCTCARHLVAQSPPLGINWGRDPEPGLNGAQVHKATAETEQRSAARRRTA
jgi:hypothetical protein